MTPAERFENNKGLMWMVFHRVPRFMLGNNKRDILQEGYIHLWKACLTYNPNLGIEFSTYAVKIIQRGIISYIHQNSLVIRPPTNSGKWKWDVWDWLKRHIWFCSMSPTIEDVRTTRNLKINALLEKVLDSIKAVQGRDGDILRKRLINGWNLTEIGEYYNFSKQRAEQIYKRALCQGVHTYMIQEYGWCWCPDCNPRNKRQYMKRV